MPKTVAALGAFVLCLYVTSGWARDLGQWENSDPETRHWFQALRQPDNLMPCCGEGDGYWADEVHVSEFGEVVATVTDDRSDGPLARSHVPIGTKYIIPANKVVDARIQGGNPTGHTIIFLGTVQWIEGNNQDPTRRHVLCYVQGWGL